MTQNAKKYLGLAAAALLATTALGLGGTAKADSYQLPDGRYYTNNNNNDTNYGNNGYYYDPNTGRYYIPYTTNTDNSTALQYLGNGYYEDPNTGDSVQLEGNGYYYDPSTGRYQQYYYDSSTGTYRVYDDNAGFTRLPFNDNTSAVVENSANSVTSAYVNSLDGNTITTGNAQFTALLQALNPTTATYAGAPTPVSVYLDSDKNVAYYGVQLGDTTYYVDASQVNLVSKSATNPNASKPQTQDQSDETLTPKTKTVALPANTVVFSDGTAAIVYSNPDLTNATGKLAANTTEWQAGQVAENSDGQVTAYALGTNQWVSATHISRERGKSGAIQLAAGTQMYDQNGTATSTVSASTYYKVYAERYINGKQSLRIGNNSQWVYAADGGYYPNK